MLDWINPKKSARGHMQGVPLAHGPLWPDQISHGQGRGRVRLRMPRLKNLEYANMSIHLSLSVPHSFVCLLSLSHFLSHIYWLRNDDVVSGIRPVDTRFDSALEVGHLRPSHTSHCPTFGIDWNSHSLPCFSFLGFVSRNSNLKNACIINRLIINAAKQFNQSIFVISVDAANAGAGNLEIMVNDGSVPCNVQTKATRQYHASFIPTDPVTHFVRMKFNNKDVPGTVD